MHALAGVRGNVYLSKIAAVCLRNSPFFGAHNRLFYSPRGCLSFFLFGLPLFTLFFSICLRLYSPIFPSLRKYISPVQRFSFHTLAPSNPMAIFILIPHCIPIYSQTFHPNLLFPSLPLCPLSNPFCPLCPWALRLPHRTHL